MPLQQDRKEKLFIERPVKFGGNLSFSTYQEIEDAFVNKKLHPLDLKNSLATEINALLELFRKNKTKLEQIAMEAYN